MSRVGSLTWIGVYETLFEWFFTSDLAFHRRLREPRMASKYFQRDVLYDKEGNVRKGNVQCHVNLRCDVTCEFSSVSDISRHRRLPCRLF